MFGIGSIRLHQELGKARREARRMADKKHCYILRVTMNLETEVEKEAIAKGIVETIRNIPEVRRISDFHIFE